MENMLPGRGPPGRVGTNDKYFFFIWMRVNVNKLDDGRLRGRIIGSSKECLQNYAHWMNEWMKRLFSLVKNYYKWEYNLWICEFWTQLRSMND